MKRIASLLLIAAIAALAQPAPVTIRLLWDSNAPEEEVTAYHVYQSDTLTGPFAMIQTVTNATAIVTLPAPSRRYWYVTAVNFWQLESEPSNITNTPGMAGKVQGLKIEKGP